MSEPSRYRQLSDAFYAAVLQSGYQGDVNELAAIGAGIYDIVEAADRIVSRTDDLLELNSDIGAERAREVLLEFLFFLVFEFDHIRRHCEDASQGLHQLIEAMEATGKAGPD